MAGRRKKPRGRLWPVPVSGTSVTCRQFVELVTDYFEGALDEPAVSLVAEHLAFCDWCATYADQMNATVAALGGLPPEPVPEKLHHAIDAALVGTGSSNGRRGQPPAPSGS